MALQQYSPLSAPFLKYSNAFLKSDSTVSPWKYILPGAKGGVLWKEKNRNKAKWWRPQYAHILNVVSLECFCLVMEQLKFQIKTPHLFHFMKFAFLVVACRSSVEIFVAIMTLRYCCYCFYCVLVSQILCRIFCKLLLSGQLFPEGLASPPDKRSQRWLHDHQNLRSLSSQKLDNFFC